MEERWFPKEMLDRLNPRGTSVSPRPFVSHFETQPHCLPFVFRCNTSKMHMLPTSAPHRIPAYIRAAQTSQGWYVQTPIPFHDSSGLLLTSPTNSLRDQQALSLGHEMLILAARKLEVPWFHVHSQFIKEKKIGGNHQQSYFWRLSSICECLTSIMQLRQEQFPLHLGTSCTGSDILSDENASLVY